MINLTDLSIYVGCIVEYEDKGANAVTFNKQIHRSIITDTDKYYIYVMRPEGVQQLSRGDIIDIKAPLTESELLIRRL